MGAQGNQVAMQGRWMGEGGGWRIMVAGDKQKRTNVKQLGKQVEQEC